MSTLLNKITCAECARSNIPDISPGYGDCRPVPRYDCFVGGKTDKEGNLLKCKCSEGVRKAGCRCCAICRHTKAWRLKHGSDTTNAEKCGWCDQPVEFAFEKEIFTLPEDHLSSLSSFLSSSDSDCDYHYRCGIYGMYNSDIVSVRAVTSDKLHDFVEKEIKETRKKQFKRNSDIRQRTRCTHYIKPLCRDCRKMGDRYDCNYAKAWERSYQRGKYRCPCFGRISEPDLCRTCQAITTKKVDDDNDDTSSNDNTFLPAVAGTAENSNDNACGDDIDEYDDDEGDDDVFLPAGTADGEGDRCIKCDAPVIHTYYSLVDPIDEDDADYDDMFKIQDRSFESLHQLVEEKKRLRATRGGARGGS